ncbi:MAG: toll/interleukin-1 receptor domain-containing protein [Longimicrobiaceae bacterium]
MSTAELIVPPPAAPPGVFWMQLLSLMQERKVIPIVGHDAIVVQDEHGPCTLNEYLARRVAVALGLGAVDPRQSTTLNQVVCHYLERPGAQLVQVYSAVKFALSAPPVAVPDALRKLAGIDAFQLYVTTTFDNLLQRAIDAERFGGEKRTQWLAYAPGRPGDLEHPVEELGVPVVYHLLGRVSALPDYVVTEEDTLEFVHSLQSETRRPNNLVHELRSHSILMIGSGYSDWLMRFFLRIAKGERLMVGGFNTEFLIDARTRDDLELRQFLRYFSAQTQVFEGDALGFIDQLAARWQEVSDAGLDDDRPRDHLRAAPAVAGANPIFLSYASEDRPRAQKLAEALERRRLPVWFDRLGGLEGGDDYEREIRASIRESSFFTPLLSRSVLTRDDRFFRLEWRTAIDYEPRVHQGRRYILPLRLDDEVSPNADGIPEPFARLHWTDARSDAEIDDAADYIRDLYRDYQRDRRPG